MFWEYNFMSIIEDTIKKYSGGDDAYALKLKTGIRDAMGYSNYMSRLGQETAGAAPIGDIKGLSPAGVKERIGTRFGMQDENVRTLGAIAGGIDTAAGSIASDQISRARTAASAAGMFEPKDWLDKQIRNFITERPTKEDGTPLSVDEFKTQLFGQVMGEGSESDVLFQPGLSEEVINQRITQRLPSDFEENSGMYKYKAMGYTKAQAENLVQFDRYSNDEMSPEEKEAFALTQPTLANKAEIVKQSAGITKDLGVVEDPETGEVHMKLSYDELRNKYPNMPEADLKELVKPTAKVSLVDDIKKNLNVNVIPEEVIKGDVSAYVDFMDSDSYKKQEQIIKLQYGKMFTPQELEQIIFETVMNGL